MVVTCRYRPESLETDLRRDVGRHAAAGRVRAHTLDLADAESVRGFADWYRDNHDGLDALVNNAGILLDVFSRWSEPRRSNDGFEIHWRTNFLGTVHLTTALLPLLMASGQASGDARVINVVSHQHIRGRNAWFLAAPLHYDSSSASTGSPGTSASQLRAESPAGEYNVRSAAVHDPATEHGLPGPSGPGDLQDGVAALSTPRPMRRRSSSASDPQLQGGRPVAPHSNEAELEAPVGCWDRTARWVSP